MNQKTILFLTGPSCSGKSTIFKSLAEELPYNYLVSYDKLKLQLHNYDRVKHRQVMRNISIGCLEMVCREGLFVLLELWQFDEVDYSLVNAIAEKHGYVFKTIHITASKDVLIERSHDRVSTGIENSREVMARYTKSFDVDQYLPAGTSSIDTSILSTKEVVQNVLDMLK